MLLAEPLEFEPKLDSWIYKSSFSPMCGLSIFKLSLEVQEYFISFADSSIGITYISEQMIPN